MPQLTVWLSKNILGQPSQFRPEGVRVPDDIASAALFAMSNTFLTGLTIKVDGGEPLT